MLCFVNNLPLPKAVFVFLFIIQLLEIYYLLKLMSLVSSPMSLLVLNIIMRETPGDNRKTNRLLETRNYFLLSFLLLLCRFKPFGKVIKLLVPKDMRFPVFISAQHILHHLDSFGRKGNRFLMSRK